MKHALKTHLFRLAAGFASALVALAGKPVSAQTGAALPPVPADFPRFEVAGQDEAARLVSNYLWYHFVTRQGNSKVLFNKEYLAVSDLWMAGAVDPHRKKPIQAVHREDLLGIQIDAEGYVHTHQHRSHALDQGWPFPMWTQGLFGWNEDNTARGGTFGWHFCTEGWSWANDTVKAWKNPVFMGETAAKMWTLENAVSDGMNADKRWALKASGPSPKLASPPVALDPLNCPYLQLRWSRTGQPPAGRLPYVEWLREGDAGYSPERRVYFGLDEGEHAPKGLFHSIIKMDRHPLWQGKIVRLRLSLAPGESEVSFAIDSFFTCYDTRHTINNPIFILASWDYFRWTGDVDFLRRQINRMRLALRYQQTEMGGLEFNHIRNRWTGHDGRPGWVNKPGAKDGKEHRPGHGIGNNYWDLMPFGYDDFYSTAQYYAATLVMAEAEEALAAHPGWGAPRGALALKPAALRQHASQVKKTANKKFWNPKTGRFVGAIDADGKAWDYGLTFVNLDAIWYGIASDAHARQIIDWIGGKRIVKGDTSTGQDIYRWRFGPRATTLRNVEWYGQGWTHPENIPWGGQVQDGGGVLGFEFFDLMARLRVLGPDDAWTRLTAMLDWEKEVQAAGGYRAYYKDGSKGTTLQGGGTAGGIGIDAEFFESSLVPAFMVRGLLGIEPGADGLSITPRLPQAAPRITVRNLLFQGATLDVSADAAGVEVAVTRPGIDPVSVRVGVQTQSLTGAGTWRWAR